MNLLVNAVEALEKSGGEDKQIVVRTHREDREDGPWVSVSIIDNGPGIPEKDLGRLFEPFFTTKPVGEGTGLGLSISHGIIQEHDGELVAANEPGGGACFTILLPVREPSTEMEDST